MRLGVTGHMDAGKTTLTKALEALLGEKVITYDTEAAKVESWLNLDSDLDGVILVVSLTDGPMPYTRKHIEIVSKINVQPLGIWLNKKDNFELSEEWLEVIEVEIRELMSVYGLEDERLPAVAGSALKALQELQEEFQNGNWVNDLIFFWDKVKEYYRKEE